MKERHKEQEKAFSQKMFKDQKEEPQCVKEPNTFYLEYENPGEHKEEQGKDNDQVQKEINNSMNLSLEQYIKFEVNRNGGYVGFAKEVKNDETTQK